MGTSKKKTEPPKTEEPSKEVAVVQQSAGAVAIPDFMRKDVGKGHEGIGVEDVELPRLILLQGLSPAVQEDGETPGQLYHTITEEALGDSVTIVPIFVRKRFVLWRPRHDGGGILARADDAVHWDKDDAFEIHPIKGDKRTVTWKTGKTVAESGLAEWGSYDPQNPDSQPAATLVFDIVMEIVERPDLGMMVLSLQRSSIKIARKFLTKLKLGDAPSFGRLFELSVTEDSNGTDNFYNFAFKGRGLVTSEADYLRFKKIYEVFSKTGFKVRDEEAYQSHDEATTGDGSDPEI